jgi:carbamate kinase
VDRNDPAFADPTKFIGPVYEEAEARRLAAEKGWSIKQDGDKWRRVVASPLPQHIFEVRPIKWMLERKVIVICAGGGGIPCVYDDNRKLSGIEAVIDKDLASELLARELEADLFIMATDADAVYLDWNKPTQKAIKTVSPETLKSYEFAAGSMGPKVDAACHFVEHTGKRAMIGALSDLKGMLDGEAGTNVTATQEGIVWHSS